ncbi:hypothetical protein HH_1617 [Helicobacter hepaticus ATCC 51449]|uniref:Uncharacterized protein n=1 Tax=Helicobacter hepaticus (strain ATCC 51449 / 3B1) TaxID=235279 RepID=Q7VFQ8_HELHP|nr:hypothetical protein HH_1617 [Helicobacter hepaticus ATCC 51449]
MHSTYKRYIFLQQNKNKQNLLHYRILKNTQ